MTWYETDLQIQQSEWKKLISKPKIVISEFLQSQQFVTQLTKHANSQILAWIQTNYREFFDQLLKRCLILPKQSQSQVRKYKQPRQSIEMLCSVLDSIAANANPASFLPTSSITGSVYPAVGTSAKVSCPETIAFIIQKMFFYYTQNDPKKLMNTFIPGSFNRIFESLNRSHCQALTTTLKTSQQGKLQKLLQTHGQYEQIIKCIQTILIVFFNQNSVNTNLQMSVTFQNSAPLNINAIPSSQSPVQHPTNYPFEIKFRLLMTILQKIETYKRITDYIYLQNIISIVLQILKNANAIYEGPTLVQYICQSQSLKAMIRIAIHENNEELFQCQIKCLEVLKLCVHFMLPVQRVNLLQSFEDMVRMIMDSSKPTLKLTYILQALNQWFLAQSGQTNPSLSLTSSLRSSFSKNNSLSYSSTTIKNGSVSPQAQQLFTRQKIFQKLIRLCVSSPNCNIFHNRVKNFIKSAFKSQNEPIINFIFKQNGIIEQTVQKIKDFKLDPHFGQLMDIMEIFTTKRIDTQQVKEAINNTAKTWEKFINEVAGYHFQVRLKFKPGELTDVKDNQPIQYTVVKNEKNNRNSLKKKQNAAASSTPNLTTIATAEPAKDKKQNNMENKASQITLIKLDLQNQPKLNKKQSEQAFQPISLNFTKKNSQQKQQKSDRDSFQSFLKKKMGEGNKLVDERRKSKTPTKMISGAGQKRNKWAAEQEAENTLTPQMPRKTISADDKQPGSETNQPEQLLPKICLIRISGEAKPKKQRERKINQQNDFYLTKWMQKLKTSARLVR